jgi:hypothetical protein
MPVGRRHRARRCTPNAPGALRAGRAWSGSRIRSTDSSWRRATAASSTSWYIRRTRSSTARDPRALARRWGASSGKRLARWTVPDSRLLLARGAAPRAGRQTLLVELCNDLRPAQLALAEWLCRRFGLRLAGRLLTDRRQGPPRVLPPRWHRNACRCGALSARAKRGAAAARLCYGVFQPAALRSLAQPARAARQGMHSTSARSVLAHVHSSVSVSAGASLFRRSRASNTCASVSFKSMREANPSLRPWTPA